MAKGYHCLSACCYRWSPLNDWFEAHFYNFITVALMLIVYGVVFLWIEKRNQEQDIQPSVTHLAKMSYLTALYIGLFQVLSLIPGTSRSGATIIGGCWLALAARWRPNLPFS